MRSPDAGDIPPHRRGESFLPADPVARATGGKNLREWQGAAEGAYGADRLRAQKGDRAIFQSFCQDCC